VVGATSSIGKRLECALGYSGRQERTLPHSGWMETTVLLEEPEALDAEMIQEDEVAAKVEAVRLMPGLTMFTDGSRLDSGAAGYVVTWQNGQRWVCIKTHMGYNQEAYDAECATLARALETAVRRQMTPERVTIFTDAQAVIRCMASEEQGPGQMYALQARKHIATLRRARPDITIEIRWCPAHRGVPGSEKADVWAKLVADEPGARGVEWLQAGARPRPLPRSLAHLKGEISEKKWDEARCWAGSRVTTRKYRLPRKQQPDRDSGRQLQEACL
jgi:ribonuclease HI